MTNFLLAAEKTTFSADGDTLEKVEMPFSSWYEYHEKAKSLNARLPFREELIQMKVKASQKTYLPTAYTYGDPLTVNRYGNMGAEWSNSWVNIEGGYNTTFLSLKNPRG